MAAAAPPQQSRPSRSSISSHGSGSRGPGHGDRRGSERSESRRGGGEGHRERDREAPREHRDRERGDREGREVRPPREHGGSRRERRGDHGEHADRDRRSSPSTRPRPPDDLDAWLDSNIADCDKPNEANAQAPREKIPKRPSSRADSRPREKRSDADAAARQQSERSSRAAEQKPVQQPPAAPAPAPAPAPAHAPAPAPVAAPVRPTRHPDMPLTEVHSDDEIEVNENVRPNAQVQPPGGKVRAPKPVPSSQRSPVNASLIEEDIAVEPVQVAKHRSPKKDDAHDEIDEEVEYDEDFEDASGDEEEYKPKVSIKPLALGSSPSPEPGSNGASRMVSIRPDVGSARASSPGISSSRDPSAMADIRKAMEDEKRKAQMSSAPVQNTTDSQASKKGIFAEYESTMPKFNLASGSKKEEKAALQRLRDLRKLKFHERRTVEKIDLFSQRPQTAHSLFLANKSLKYCRSKTVSCQTGEDDVEVGINTDDVWTEDKEMQAPALTVGTAGRSGGEPSQMLPFLRRTLPLFEASLAESRRRQLPIAGQPGMAPEPDNQRVRMHSIFGLPDSFISRCIDANVNIADITVCPEWYGADHTLVLYTWPWKQRPPPDSAHLLDSFTRPMQSLIALYPIISGSGGNIIHPSRCLYSFCRLSSMVVVGGRSHIVAAGTEMGSLLVWDLREKARLPTEHNQSGSDSSVPAFEADPDMAHFQGALWLGAAFSTDSFTFSSTDMARPDADFNDEEPELNHSDSKAASGTGVHNVEICCVRCSEGAGSDPLIFALDLMGTISFWRVLEFASMRGTQVKLALQGSISLQASAHSLGSFMDARALCIHPQQQMQFVVVGTSGVHQAHRHQRTSSVSDGPGSFELLGRLDEDSLGSITQPCSAAFNPFFPGLLLVAYAEGDMALFDCTMCVPMTHWSGAISKAPNPNITVAWSTVRPCVFYVKSLETLEIWDLAERSYAPVDSVELGTHLGVPAGPGTDTSSELYVTAKGHPVVAYNGKTVVLNVSSGLTTPLQAAPAKYVHDEMSIDALLVSGCEAMCVFPTLQRHSRKIDVADVYTLERDVMRRIMAGIHPLQASQAWAEDRT